MNQFFPEFTPSDCNFLTILYNFYYSRSCSICSSNQQRIDSLFQKINNLFFYMKQNWAVASKNGLGVENAYSLAIPDSFYNLKSEQKQRFMTALENYFILADCFQEQVKNFTVEQHFLQIKAENHYRYQFIVKIQKFLGITKATPLLLWLILSEIKKVVAEEQLIDYFFFRFLSNVSRKRGTILPEANQDFFPTRLNSEFALV